MTKQQALCTIICPVYNKAQYIRKCFDSILMQKTRYRFKVLVIDDKSTDNSCDIIGEYAEKFPDIFTVHKNSVNMKLAATAIKAYAMLDTKYYCVLDPDDYWADDDHLDRAISFLEQNPQYTAYGTNSWILKGDGRKPLNDYNFKTQTFDLGRGESIYTHTSATFFVNTFTPAEIEKLNQYIGTEFENCFRGETFRNMLAAHRGLKFVNNECKSVYNFDYNGVWSSMDKINADIMNARLMLEAYSYFGRQDMLYLSLTRYYLDLCIRGGAAADPRVTELYDKFLSILKQENLLTFFGYRKNIVFWLPAKTFGGYETCFIRLARYLSQHFDFNIFYVDYPDGIAPKYLKNTNVSLIKYANRKKISLPDDSFVFTPMTLAYQMHTRTKRKNNIKIGFWWAHPLAYPWTKFRSGLADEILLKFLGAALKHRAIHVMDGVCKYACDNVLKTDDEAVYLPVFIQPGQTAASVQPISADQVNLLWLGRLDRDKIFGLLNVLHNFEQWNTDKKKRIHIIGTGDSENLIVPGKYPSLEIIKTGRLTDDALDEYMAQNVDVMFGMGTSMLEAAKLGIPAVLVQAFEAEDYSNKYINLFDLSEYILGYTDQDAIKNLETKTMQDILDNIVTHRAECIAKTREYLDRNHTIKASAYKFIHNMALSALSFDKHITIGQKPGFFQRLKLKKKK